MEIIKDNNKVYILKDNKEVAYVTFPNIDETTVNINHTYVSESLRGMKIASKLLEEAYRIIKSNNKKAIIECSYAKKWFENNKEYNDILK